LTTLENKAAVDLETEMEIAVRKIENIIFSFRIVLL